MYTCVPNKKRTAFIEYKFFCLVKKSVLLTKTRFAIKMPLVIRTLAVHDKQDGQAGHYRFNVTLKIEPKMISN